MKCFLFFGTTFANMKSIWKKIYILPHIATNNTYLRSFHYKILNRILFLNKRLFVFRMKSTPLCSFCNIEEETLPRIFSECVFVIYLWQLLAIFFFFFFFFWKQFDFTRTYTTDCLTWALKWQLKSQWTHCKPFFTNIEATCV